MDNPTPVTQTPSEEVVPDAITETPQPFAVEENNSSDIPTENPTDNDTPPAEAIESEEGGKKDQPALSHEQLEAKLKEYEIKEQEALELRERLNIQNDSIESVHIDNIEATIDNKAQQGWIKLCNEYGVDYSPNGIDQSMQVLLEKDPKAYYEFKSRGESLYNSVSAQKKEIRDTRLGRDLGMFVEANKPILENSPAVRQIVDNYIQQNYSNMSDNAVQELNGLMDVIKMVYLEAVDVGKNAYKYETVANDKAGISGQSSIATASTPAYPLDGGKKIFTRDEVRRMDTRTFDKYRPIIEQQMKEGLIK